MDEYFARLREKLLHEQRNSSTVYTREVDEDGEQITYEWDDHHTFGHRKKSYRTEAAAQRYYKWRWGSDLPADKMPRFKRMMAIKNPAVKRLTLDKWHTPECIRSFAQIRRDDMFKAAIYIRFQFQKEYTLSSQEPEDHEQFGMWWEKRQIEISQFGADIGLIDLSRKDDDYAEIRVVGDGFAVCHTAYYYDPNDNEPPSFHGYQCGDRGKFMEWIEVAKRGLVNFDHKGMNKKEIVVELLAWFDRVYDRKQHKVDVYVDEMRALAGVLLFYKLEGFDHRSKSDDFEPIFRVINKTGIRATLMKFYGDEILISFRSKKDAVRFRLSYCGGMGEFDVEKECNRFKY